MEDASETQLSLFERVKRKLSPNKETEVSQDNNKQQRSDNDTQSGVGEI